MIRHLTPLTLVALIAATAPALAQDTTATGETAAPATEETAQPPAQEAAPETGSAQLDLGQPADGTPELGQRYSKEKFGDWDLACIKTEAEKDPCSLLQILHGRDRQRGRRGVDVPHRQMVARRWPAPR